MQTTLCVSQLKRTWILLCVFVISGCCAWGQTTIVSDGFNNNSSLFTVSGGTYYSGSSATGDGPANSPFNSEGTAAYGVSNGTGILTSNASISTYGYSNIQLSLRLASFSLTTASNGADASDKVVIGISTDGGTTYTNCLTVAGYNNAYWAYSATGVAITSYPITNSFAPSAKGLRTTDGYSTLIVTSLPAITNLKVKITLSNDDVNERWVIDDFKITGTASSTVTITTGNITGSPFCVTGSSAPVSVPFNYSPAPTFATATFTAQLSDASGSFASPTNIGTVTSDNSGNQTINASIPASTSSGVGYRIRVVSNNPSVTGTDNGSNLSVTYITSNAVNLTGTTSQNIAQNGNGSLLTATAANASNYVWKYGTTSGNYSSTIPGATSPTYTPVATDFGNTLGTYYLVGQATSSCGNIVGMSNEVQVKIFSATTSADYFRCKQTGDWSALSTWESSTDSINWINASLLPTSSARRIIIQSNDTVTVSDGSRTMNNTEVDGTLFFSGISAKFTMPQNGIMNINNGGTVRFVTGSTDYVSVVSLGSGSIITINTGGTISVGNGAATGSGMNTFAADATGTYVWKNGSVFEWNATSFPTSKVTLFPSVNNTTIPIFRVTNSGVVGSSAVSPTSIFGLTEMNVNLVWQNNGKINFRNGIIGSGSVNFSEGATITIGDNAGIANTSAVLGGNGSILKGSINTLAITIAPNCTTSLLTPKTISNARITVSSLGVLNFGSNQITGTADTLVVNGTCKTENANGFSDVTTGSIPLSSFNSVTNNSGSTIDYTSSSTQTITANNYYNLSNSGNGLRTLANGSTIGIANTFSTGTGTYTTTGSTVNFNGINQTVPVLPGANYNNLTTSISGIATMGGNIVIDNTLSLSKGSLSIGSNTLTVSGTISHTNGSITGSSTSNLDLNGSATKALFLTPGSYYMHNVTISSSATNVSLDDSLYIVAGSTFGTLTCNGLINTNGFLTLKSNAAGDAVIGQSTGVINGNVTVERYLPGRRAWRLLSVPVASSQTINQAWQEGVANTTTTQPIDPHPGYGTDITYDNDITHGFDVNTTTNSSLKTWVSASNSWTAVPFTTSPINTYAAYCIFVRGSRAVNLSLGTSSPSNATTLRVSGTVHTGAYTASYSTSAGNSILVANPYASSINILSVLNRNSSNFTNNKFRVWDPAIAGVYGVGGYITYNQGIFAPASSQTNYTGDVNAQSGQAFMLEATTSGNTAVSFLESDKVSTQANVFGRTTKSRADYPVIYTNLLVPAAGSSTLIDGVAAGFNNNFSATVDKDDAVKLWNFNENISVARDSQQLAIEMRPLPKHTDTLFYTLYLKQQPYTLQIFSENVKNNMPVQAWLIDAYLNTKTEVNLSDTTLYAFTPASDTNSYRHRFMLVFNKDSKAGMASLPTPPFIPEPQLLQNNFKAQVYPNPVKNGVISLQLTNLTQGNYTVIIYNSLGQVMYRKKIEVKHDNTTQNENFKLTNHLQSGNYSLQIMEEKSSTQKELHFMIGR